MELRTTFEIIPSEQKISYYDPVMFIGSCFATSIGNRFQKGRMPVMINPAGTVYNPVSVCNTLDFIAEKKIYTSEDLYNYKGTWISFDHYTDFSSTDCEEILERINRRSEEAHSFLSSTRFLFVTFGTARTYIWIKSGKIVSNCHKIPSGEFHNELLSVDAITSLWDGQLNKLKQLYPGLKVIFTISPIRHWKDGAHGNQVSKSVLFLAVEKLLKHPTNPEYFPAYELIMDDLRDYRFYNNDMLHLSDMAVDYIWEKFCNCYFEEPTKDLWREISKISGALSHEIQTSNQEQIKLFAQTMISRIESLQLRYPQIALENEKKYFLDLIK
jgi:hypothetical protein